ncbi:GntR family transcriptional regulator [Arenibacter sp. S6351L]|uniref:GntR family transcriptional regulator n=1 Tax=Arenibacter sp. S6351L TaxID=2926407 RepID=UPI001FF1C02D|nr:GntR family transcriptional regulator [Arenibacter sp. S6351L]MCK0136799.1 GntR family transcriptional regulator [Arenibacter sp. S6351L]
MDKKTIKRSGDTSDLLLQRLLEEIVSGTLPAGKPIRETQLALKWEVSRTPVREAVRSAAAMGLIELRPNQRPLVKNYSQKDLINLTEVRIALELLAFDNSIDILIGSIKVKKLLEKSVTVQNSNLRKTLTKKALEVDTNLHRLWIDSCENQFIVFTFESLWPFIRILQRVAANDTNRASLALSEHISILKAIYEDEKELARQLLENHLRSSTPLLQQLLKKNNDKQLRV